jgi:hypothetical protein
MITALQPLLLKFAQMEGSGIAVEYATELPSRIREEAEGGEVYVRADFLIVTGS